MDDALRTTRRTIAVLSPDYLVSAFAEAEWTATVARDPRGARLLPLRVADCRPDGLLGSTIYVDLVGVDESAATQRLLAGVGEQRPKPAVPPDYPGGVAMATAAAQSPGFPCLPPPLRRFLERLLAGAGAGSGASPVTAAGVPSIGPAATPARRPLAGNPAPFAAQL